MRLTAYDQETIFDESYHLQSATGVINLEVPIGALSRALRSGIGASSAQLRLTKKGSIPLLALTIVASSWTEGNNALGVESADALDTLDAADVGAFADDMSPQPTKRGGRRAPTGGGRGPRERETVITQEIPVKVLHQSVVEGLHEPRCRDPDVHIVLPSLAQLKAISDRFTKLASASGSVFGASAGGGGGKSGGTLSSSSLGPKLELSANMHGSLKLAIATDALRISSIWTGLLNPNIDVAQMSEAEIAQLPSERMRALGAEANGDEEAGWAKVRIDGKDWGRVLSVGRLSPKVVACKPCLYVTQFSLSFGLFHICLLNNRLYSRDCAVALCISPRKMGWRRILFDCEFDFLP